MFAASDPLDAAASLASSSVATQVWYLIVVVFAVGCYFLKMVRDDSIELRKEIKEQSAKREQSMQHLSAVVEANTSAMHQNSEVLSDSRYQLKRSQETLDKFSK